MNLLYILTSLVYFWNYGNFATSIDDASFSHISSKVDVNKENMIPNNMHSVPEDSLNQNSLNDDSTLSRNNLVNPDSSTKFGEVGENIESQIDMALHNKEVIESGEDTVNVTMPSNETVLSATPTNDTKKLISCKLRTTDELYEVEMVNGTRLVEILTPDSEITNKETEAQCAIVMFYSRLCPFSAMAAPHFNALARTFPNIKMLALDALSYHGFNTQYGIVGVPTLIMFHNGRPVAKFNGTEYTIHSFAKFLTTFTGMKEEDVAAVLSQDFQGPVPSVTDKEIDYFLVLSWSFIILCAVYFFSKSFLWKVITEKVKSIWREAEAQHDHLE